MVFYLKHIKNSFAASLLLLALILTSAFGSVITTHTSQAETGKGEDISELS
jgi:cell division protein FtsL